MAKGCLESNRCGVALYVRKARCRNTETAGRLPLLANIVPLQQTLSVYFTDSSTLRCCASTTATDLLSSALDSRHHARPITNYGSGIQPALIYMVFNRWQHE